MTTDRFAALRDRAAAKKALTLEASRARVQQAQKVAPEYLRAWQDAHVLAAGHAYGTLSLLLEAKGISQMTLDDLADVCVLAHRMGNPKSRGARMWKLCEPPKEISSGWPRGRRTMALLDVQCRFCSVTLHRDASLGSDYSKTVNVEAHCLGCGLGYLIGWRY